MISRINQLKNQTNSNKIKAICESAIGILSSVVYNNVTPEAKYEIERTALENLFENLQNFKNDIVVKEWLNNTNRIYAIKNIGVRKAINILEQSEAKFNPTLKEILIQYKEMLLDTPEVLLYESFLPALEPFGYLPTVQQQIDYVEDIVKKYNIDIEISKIIEAMKTSKSNYLLPLIEDVVETYLTNKTEQSKHYLKETLIKFSYDDFVRSIINLVNADATNLQLEYANAFCDIEKIYSPLFYLGENEVIFNIKGRYFVKKGNNVSKLSKEYVSNLNPEFISLCETINNPIITIKNNNNIELYSDKDIAVINKNGVTVNESFLSVEQLNESLEIAPMTGKTEFYSLIKTLYENFDEFAEIDFVKRVSLKENTDYAADIFKLRDNIFISTYDPINNKDTFYRNVNPIQAKEIMMEHLRYDVSKVFEDILPKEEKILAEVEETKAEYANYINLIETKLNVVLSQPNNKIKDELVKILTEELSEIKIEYQDYLNEVEKYIRPLNEEVTVTVNVDGKKYIVPIPKEEDEVGSAGDEDSLTANYTNDEPASQVTFDDQESELLGDSPSRQEDEVDLDQDRIEDEIDSIEKEKEQETEENPEINPENPEEEEGKAGTEVTSDEEENKEGDEEEKDENGNPVKKEKKPLKKESFVKEEAEKEDTKSEVKKSKKVFLKKKLTETSIGMDFNEPLKDIDITKAVYNSKLQLPLEAVYWAAYEGDNLIENYPIGDHPITLYDKEDLIEFLKGLLVQLNHATTIKFYSRFDGSLEGTVNLRITESLNESFPNITDTVMYKNQKASITGQLANGDFIIQKYSDGSTEYAKPSEVKLVGVKVETMKPPFKFDEKTQKLLFEQYVKCGIYMGKVPVKLDNCYVKYSEWANTPTDKLLNVLVEGELSMLPKEQINVLEDPNDFANPSNYIQGVVIDTNGTALQNVLINAIDYTQSVGEADMIRVLNTETNELTTYPKGALKTLAV
jgi:hypothetical protein